MKRALLVIDVQNEYFPGGRLPITHPPDHLAGILRAMDAAAVAGVPLGNVPTSWWRRLHLHLSIGLAF